MSASAKSITILVADDDADDRMMAKDALDECRLSNQLHFVEDGVDLMNYLRRQGRYADAVGVFDAVGHPCVADPEE